MNRFISFLNKIYVPLLFILLEVVAINYYASSTIYTKAKMLTASNSIFGTIHEKTSNITGYFALRRENNLLLGELTRLENELSVLRDANMNKEFAPVHDTLNEMIEQSRYTYMHASVINNSVTRQENFLILDRGERDGVRTNMAVITPDLSIVGYVMEVSDKFSVVISILNSGFFTGGKIKGKDHYGSVFWDGRSSDYVTLKEINRHAEIAVGDTIISGYSSIIPPDIAIGRVESFELVRSTYYDVRVRLATDMSKIRSVYVVGYADIEERQMIEGAFFDPGT